MGRVGYSTGGGKDFKQTVFDDSTITWCVCGSTWDSSVDREFKAWEAIHRPHLEKEHGTHGGALACATKYAATLSGVDVRFNGIVQMVHKDGSTLFLRNAFALRWRGFLVVFTKNHGFFAYAVDDLHIHLQSLTTDMGDLPAMGD